jgi:predicted HicB family RNase H-like nuclease
MSHQGHSALVEYDDRDDVFVGRVLGLRSIVSFLNQWATEALERAVRSDG